MADKLSSWKEASLGKPASASVNAYLKNVDEMLDICHRAMELLNASKYAELAGENSNRLFYAIRITAREMHFLQTMVFMS